MTRMSHLILPLSAEGGTSIAPFLVGGGALVFLLFFLFGVLAFGKGRDHC